ncbi:MAG TPA: hypothetical protein VM120_04005 [Bryobacteraceae bacterium]|nr:hypothetical protein [Bryobacteraceae bacterium]
MLFEPHLQLEPAASVAETERQLRFIGAAVTQILRSLPVQRRALADGTKEAHLQVTLARRSGFCPCCQQVKVCSPYGRLEGAEYDHFYGRHRNGPDETWLVCGACNRQLEDPAFKGAMQPCFLAYQIALRCFEDDRQATLFP